jgi:hypothetical protein
MGFYQQAATAGGIMSTSHPCEVADSEFTALAEKFAQLDRLLHQG